MQIELKQFDPGKDRINVIGLIKAFWLAHNRYTPTDREAEEDLTSWTGKGHILYLIVKDGAGIGFAHLGSRGAEADWLEDLFVLPDYQNRGIGACAVGLLEDIVKQYSDSFYIEAAARNEGAIRLYHKLGYNGLNTITVRKDFSDENYNVVRTEQIHDRTFEIRRA